MKFKEVKRNLLEVKRVLLYRALNDEQVRMLEKNKMPLSPLLLVLTSEFLTDKVSSEDCERYAESEVLYSGGCGFGSDDGQFFIIISGK